MGFPELLRSLMQSSAKSENEIAKDAGINRGDLWKIANDKLFPKEKKFYKLLGAMALNPFDEKALRDEYWSRALGERRFNDILRVIDHMNGWRDELPEDDLSPVAAFGGSAELIPGAVKEFMLSARGSAIAFLPVDKDPVSASFLTCIEQRGYNDIRLIMTLLHGEGAPVDNIFRILAASRFIKKGIMPVYMHTEPSGIPALYYICTEERALLFSDEGFAVVTEPEAAKVIFDSTERIYGRCAPLGVITDNVFEVKDVYATTMHATHEAELCAYPYVSNYFTYENLASADRVQPHRKDIVGYAAQWYADVTTALKVVSSEGVERFARVGFFKEITPEYVKPFPPEQRGKILERMLADAGAGRFHIADPEKFSHPGGMDIALTADSVCMELYRYSETYGYDVHYAHLRIHDPATAQLLIDAVSFLPRLGYCLSTRSAGRHIAACIALLPECDGE